MRSAAGRETNVAAYLAARAETSPDTPALYLPHRGRHRPVSFGALAEETERIASGLRVLGVGPGDRVAVLVPPSLELFALTFALLRMGAVMVMVDPGMGVSNLGKCLAEAAPTTFIGIPRAQIAARLFGWARNSLQRRITVGRTLFGRSLDDVRELGRRETTSPFEATASEDRAAILFTSGSTGTPKGAVYTHGIFCTQVEWIRDAYGIEPGEIDLPTFPLFALFDPALGMSAVIPDMDFTRPGRVNPANVIEPIREHGVTNMFGSPAVIRRVGLHLEQTGEKLPSLRRVLSAGAPASPPDLARFRAALSGDADIHTPYGATEALPVSTIAAGEVLACEDGTRRGEGICIGRPLPDIEVSIVPIVDAPLPRWSDLTPLPPGEIGEIVVGGDVVTQEYFGRPEATALAKIEDGSRRRHRMGDLGYFDDTGRLWFCGRKSHRVITPDGDLQTIRCEGVFNAHPKVRRTALVGVDGRPVLCVEPEAGFERGTTQRLLDELRTLGGAHELTEHIDTFLIHRSFPVDVRHNSKIFRERLAVWAARRVQ